MTKIKDSFTFCIFKKMQSTNGFMLTFVVAGHRYLSVLLLPANLSMFELFRKRKDES